MVFDRKPQASLKLLNQAELRQKNTPTSIAKAQISKLQDVQPYHIDMVFT